MPDCTGLSCGGASRRRGGAHVTPKSPASQRGHGREATQPRGQKSAEPGSCPGPCQPRWDLGKTFLSQWKLQSTVQKELLAIMINYILVDNLMETVSTIEMIRQRGYGHRPGPPKVKSDGKQVSLLATMYQALCGDTAMYFERETALRNMDTRIDLQTPRTAVLWSLT